MNQRQLTNKLKKAAFLLLLFMTLAFGTTAKAGTCYFIGTNSGVSPVGKQTELNRINNWYDSAGSAWLSTGTVLDTLHTWYIAKDGELPTNITARGTVYLNSGISLNIETSKDLYITGTFYNYGTLQLVGNSQSLINVYSSGQLINYNTLNVNAGSLIVNGTVTNTANATIAGGAYLTINSGGTLNNSGTLTNNGNTTVATGGTFTNTGTVFGTAVSVPALVVSTNTSVPNGATYSGITFSAAATLTAQGNLTTTTLNMSNGTLVLGDTLTVTSSFSGMSTSNYITSDGSASLNFTGTSSGTIYVDQTTSGTTNSFNSITLNTSGTITLGNATRIDGVLTPTSGTLATEDSLTLTSSSSTSYAQIAPESTGAITGNITMQMGSSNIAAGWRPIALPLTGTISNLTGIDMLYSGHSPSNQINTYRWDATQNASTVNNNGWTPASSTDNQSNAFLIYTDSSNGGLHDFTGTLSMTGTYTTGSQVFNLYSYIDPSSSGTDATGWNFIPNPYASNLNITAVLASGSFTPTYKSVHVYDYINDQYQVYSNSGVTIVNYNNSGTAGTIKNLSPYVGFWVKSASDQTITLTNNERTTSTNNVATLLKKPYDLLRLDVIDADNKWDQCVI